MDFFEEQRIVCQHAVVFAQRVRAAENLKLFAPAKLPDQMAALFPGLGSVASFSTQVSRMRRKVRAGLAQGVFAPLGFHKTDSFRFAHAPPLVLFPGGGQTRRELQLDQLSADDGTYIHGRKINRASPFDKPRAAKFFATAETEF
jgi:hypothetical protein